MIRGARLTAIVASLALAAGCGRIGFAPVDDGGGPGDGGSDGGDAAATVPPGAVIAFHFDENAGTTTTSEGTPVVANLIGGATWVGGVRGAAVHFAANAYVDAPPAPALLLLGPITLAVWYRLDRAPITSECFPLFIHGSEGGGGAVDNDVYALNLFGAEVVLYSERLAQVPNFVSAVAPGSALSVSTWHHLIGVRDASDNITFYVDGGGPLPGGMSAGPADGGGNGHLRIGGDVDLGAGGCGTFPGALDELYVFPRALSAIEARRLFDAR